MADTGTTRDRVWGSVTTERDKAFMATVALHPHGQIWFYAHGIASWCAVNHAVLDNAVAVPHSIANSQLQSPSLIADAPLKLWLKLLDFETLESLHHKSVAACAKAKLLGQRDEAAYRTNRIMEATHRELEHRRKQQESEAQ